MLPAFYHQHFSRRALFIALVVFASLCSSAHVAAYAGTFTAFGPQTYPRSTGQPIPISNTFSVLNPSTQYILQVQVAGVASAIISVNGVTVVFTSDFDMNETYVERPVVLQASNVLAGEVRGKPDGQITVTIVGIDNDPPTISGTASPAANASGWNNSNVTVTFTADDAISGVASVTPATTVTTEGANQTVTGTATDRAGNTASATVTVNIDKTPPSVVIASPPEGAFRNTSSLTVMGSASDALSGVEAVICNGAPVSFSGTEFSCAVSLIEGTNTIMVEATDRAGNSASATVTVTLDTAPPSLLTTSPANGATFSASPITVSGTATDASSGVAGVTCNNAPALVSGSDFSCEIGLMEGSNTILVQATDAAGNHSSQSVTVTLSTTPTPAPNSIGLTPSTLALVVDEPRQLALVDDYGRAVTGASWSVSDPSAAELTTSGLIILTGKAVGEVTITATWGNLSSQATATVFAGPELPQGTVRWRVEPMEGNTTVGINKALVLNENGPDLYVVEEGGANHWLVRGLTSDGRQMWATPVVFSEEGSSAAGQTSTSTIMAASQLQGQVRLVKRGGDFLGGELLQYEDYSYYSQFVRLDASGHESWRYTSPGWLHYDWALHADGTIFVGEVPDPNAPEVYLLALDGMTGAVKFRIALPLSFYGQRSIGCVQGNDNIEQYSFPPGAPIVAPDGSVYLETQSETWILDYLPCNTGGTNTYESAVRLLQVRPDGSSIWRDIKRYSFVGGVDFHTMTLPHATLGEVIPDGQGGVLAAWTYHIIDPFNHPDAVPEARITRIMGSGASEYSLPYTGWGYCNSPVGSCSDNDYGEPPNRTLVLGENGVAMAGRWRWDNTASTGSAKVVAFDVNSGAVAWNWESPVAWFDIVAATAGNGMVGDVWQDDGSERIVRIDPTGQASYDAWTGYSLQYAQGDAWLAQGSAEEVFAPGLAWPASLFATAAQDESRSSFKHFDLGLYFCSAQNCGAYPDVEFIYQATPQSPIISLNNGQILAVRTEAFKTLRNAFAGFPGVRVFYATPTRPTRRAWVNGKDLNLCGEHSHDGTTGYIYYLTHMSGARWVVDPDFTVPTPENAAKFQRIVEAIGRGIGITSAHEFGHQFGIVAEYLDSRGVYEGGVCSPVEDPSGWTGVGPDGTPIHWGEEAAGIIRRRIFGN